MKPTRILSILAISALTACSAGTDDEESTSADSAAVTSATTDSPVVHDAPRDADQEFLRGMLDHHESMIRMAALAADSGTAASVKTDGQKLRDKQSQERTDMAAMLQRDYNDSHQPMVMATGQQMIDELTRTPRGKEFDRMFYHHTIMHHQEGIKMVDQFLARLQKPEVRQMAEKIKADQQKEITEFEAKMNAL